MSQAEYPVTTDAEEIKQKLDEVLEAIRQMQGNVNMRLDGHADGINAIGANMQWLVDNVKGLFQMFASPQFMSQMSNMLMGGIANGGQAGADTPAGEVPGGSGAGILG